MLEATKQIVAVKNIEMPDERHAFEHASVNVVNLPGVTITRTVYQPGWKWLTDVKPVVGTEACQAAHTGYIISGWLHAAWGTAANTTSARVTRTWCRPVTTPGSRGTSRASCLISLSPGVR